jgi:hypothetical protein
LPLIPVLEQKTIHDLLVLDLAGTFVFAISGAMLGVRRRLDIFGILVLSFVASSAGGITRDLLIGAVPPAAISDWRYLVVALAAGYRRSWRLFRASPDGDPVRLEFTRRTDDRKRG